MIKRGRRKPVDRAGAEKYRRIGSALLESARALATIAHEDDRFGNAIAVLAIHATIAYADTLAIAFGEVKSTEGQHERAVDTLRSALKQRAAADQLRRLRSILARKSHVSYEGTYYPLERGLAILSDAIEFARWAEQLLSEPRA